MDALTARSEFKAFAKEIGLKASISVMVTDWNEKPLLAMVYPQGHSRDSEFTVYADDFESLLAAVKAKWTEHEATHRARTIRKMALAIIKITAELGECTDAALRNCGEFDQGQVSRYGEQACADANDIAGRGPFSIVMRGGANAPDEEAAA